MWDSVRKPGNMDLSYGAIPPLDLGIYIKFLFFIFNLIKLV